MRQKIQIAGGAVALLVAAFLILSYTPRSMQAEQNSPPPPPEAPVAPPGPAFNLFRGPNGTYLGVLINDVTAKDVSAMKLPGEYGVIVRHVEPDSPAAKAGIETNDVILEFGGMRVWSASQFEQLVRETPAGRAVTLRVSRSGKMLNLDASLAQRNQPRTFSYSVNPRIQMPQFHFDFRFPKYRLGIEVESLTPQLATYFRVAQGKGVLVTEVEADSPAAKAGLKAGDCIVKAGSADVASVSDLMHALNDAAKPAIDLSIVRAGQEQTLNATLESAPSPMQNQMFRRDMERQARAIQRQAQALRRELPRREEMQRQLRDIQRKMQEQQASLGVV